MNLESLVRDRYNREARLVPALLVAFPIILAVFAWFPALRGAGTALLTLLSFCGVTVWLAHLARDRGVKLQPSLYAKWGGKPSVSALRHKGDILPPDLSGRYRTFLGQISQMKMPTAEDEARDPVAADQAYEAAGAWLLAQTRDKKRFPLIFEENVNYGFRRNFWAMKPIAVAVSAAVTFASVAGIAWPWWKNGAMPSAEVVGATGVVAIYVVLTVFLVHSEWVRVPAVAFARQLLAACDVLAAPKAVGGAKSRVKH